MYVVTPVAGTLCGLAKPQTLLGYTSVTRASQLLIAHCSSPSLCVQTRPEGGMELYMQYAADVKDVMTNAPRTASSFVKRRSGLP